MDKENCELLSVVAEDHPEFLIDDRDYTYSILTQPIRGKNCSCLTCGAFCLKENCSCTYNHDGKKQCTDGIFKILVSSEGHRDVNGTKSWGHSVIKINGKDYSKNHRGFNIVVLDGENGRVEKAINFDTHTDATDMTAFLQNITSEMSKIIIAAIKDEGAWAMTPETYKALSKLAGETVSDINHRGSFAMIGFSGDDKPSFVKQEKKSKNEGHVVIEDIIHIPVIKN